jgi:hypothetical protein
MLANVMMTVHPAHQPLAMVVVWILKRMSAIVENVAKSVIPGKTVLKASVFAHLDKTIAMGSVKISKMTLVTVVPVARSVRMVRNVLEVIALPTVPKAHPRIAPVHALTCKQT